MDHGETWQNLTGLPGSVQGVYVVNGVLMAMGNVSFRYLRYGTTWTSGSGPTDLPNAAIYDPTQNRLVLVSNNFVEWKTMTAVGLAGGFSGKNLGDTKDIVFDGVNFYVAKRTTSVAGCIQQSPGTNLSGTWTAVLLANAPYMTTIAHFPQVGRYIAGGDSTFYTSTDGTTWTLLTGHGLTGVTKIKMGTNALIAIGTSGIFKSLDGLTFTQVSPIAECQSISVDALGRVCGGGYSVANGGSIYTMDGGVAAEGFHHAPLKRWNGDSWSTHPLKRYNGSAWETVP